MECHFCFMFTLLFVVCCRTTAFTTRLLQFYLLPTLVKLGAPRFWRFLVNPLPVGTIRQLRDPIDVMHIASVKIFEAKKRSLQAGDDAVERQVGGGGYERSQRDIPFALDLLACRFGFFIIISEAKANMQAPACERIADGEVLGQVFLPFGNMSIC